MDSLTYLGPNIWNIIPEYIKNLDLLMFSKLKLRNWIPRDCPCTICRLFVQNLGYI